MSLSCKLTNSNLRHILAAITTTLYAIVDCRISTKGYRYTGTVSQTLTGIPCQRWDSNSPHHNSYYTEDFYGDVDSLSELENYCRNPDGEDGPWCYTTDVNERWAYCTETPKCTG